jgi:hypothetical protein
MKITGFLKICLLVIGLSVLSYGAYAQNTTQGVNPGTGNPGVKQYRGQHRDWKKNHPRRAEVNRRMDRQHRRIHEGVEKGTLTKQQAVQLNKDDRQVRHEERDMAAQNGGHITGAEQKALNQQENADSKQIYQEKHPGNSAH